jgi:ribosomal protein L33
MLWYAYTACLSHCYLLVCRRTNVRLEWLASRLELVRYCDVVSEQTVARHLLANYSSQNGPSVKADTHLSTHNTDI